jgi:hypothetical protein
MRYSIGDIVYRKNPSLIDYTAGPQKVTRVVQDDPCCGEPSIGMSDKDWGCSTSFVPIVKKISKAVTIWIMRGNVNEI